MGSTSNVLTNVVRLWEQASLDHKLRLQWALFPEGVDFDGEEFGTTVTCLAFNRMEDSGGSDDGMASPTGLLHWLNIQFRPLPRLGLSLATLAL